MIDAYFQQRMEEGVGPGLTLSTRIALVAKLLRVISFPPSFSM